MRPDDLVEDLKNRRELAGGLARYADGNQGLGLGTALAGVLAMAGGPIAVLIGRTILHIQTTGAMTQVELARSLQRQHLFNCLTFLFLALAWQPLRDRLQAYLYKSHGDARATLPSWELRFGNILQGLFAGVGLWAGISLFTAKPPAGTTSSGLHYWGSPSMKVLAATVVVSTAILLATSWRKMGGWRNCLGWISLYARFLFAATLPLLGDPAPHPFAGGVVMLLLVASDYFPFVTLFVGARDHLRYRRLVKELGALVPIEAQA